tara:strand:- start:654 stop:1604 length:951 start_codon:yes stop_codon:yes gene_type:complete
MIIVTGSNGFIGSNLIKGLNSMGITNILAVDDHENFPPSENLSNCEFKDLVKIEDIDKLLRKYPNKDISHIFHQGACSDTMEKDINYMLKNNYLFSKDLLTLALEKNINFIYASSASVYGDGKIFEEDKKYEKPINLYAYSKFIFDQYVRELMNKNDSQIVGLRYFNVYGPNEQHKGRMASVAFHLHQQLKESKSIKLFEGSDGYEDGEQKRDFIHVDDVVKVNLWFMKNEVSGIFNVGTGLSQSFNDVANAVIKWNKKGKIEYIPFPEELIGSYQSYTQANIDQLRNAGYKDEFLTVEEGVSSYLSTLQDWPSND